MQSFFVCGGWLWQSVFNCYCHNNPPNRLPEKQADRIFQIIKLSENTDVRINKYLDQHSDLQICEAKGHLAD